MPKVIKDSVLYHRIDSLNVEIKKLTGKQELDSLKSYIQRDHEVLKELDFRSDYFTSTIDGILTLFSLIVAIVAAASWFGNEKRIKDLKEEQKKTLTSFIDINEKQQKLVDEYLASITYRVDSTEYEVYKVMCYMCRDKHQFLRACFWGLGALFIQPKRMLSPANQNLYYEFMEYVLECSRLATKSDLEEQSSNRIAQAFTQLEALKNMKDEKVQGFANDIETALSILIKS